MANSLIVLLCLLTMAALPVAAQPAPETVAGDWEGALDLGAASLRIVFHITQDGSGKLVSTLDSPDQGATGIPVEKTEIEGRTLKLHVSAIGGVYEGTLNDEASELSGTWSQSGQSFPLDLKKTETPTEVNRPQEPERPFPYDEEDVRFDGGAEGVTLAGTLTMPRGAGPFPAVVLISGSGPQDRNETLMGHQPFFVLSDYLTRQGIAVLRYDDRGVGESTGEFAAATSKDFARDAQGAVSLLKSQPKIDGAKIGLLGHSEGGLIAPMAAERSDDVAFIVMLASPGLPGKDILMLQSGLIARAGGMTEPLIEKMLTVNEKLYDTTIANADSPDLNDKLLSTIDALKDNMSADEAKALGIEGDRANQIVTQLSSPWFKYFLSYDPRPALEKATVPILSLIGEKDLQVPARENTKAIEAALSKSSLDGHKAEILPGLNHLFQTANTGAPGEYGQTEETMSPVAMEKVARWIETIVSGF